MKFYNLHNRLFTYLCCPACKKSLSKKGDGLSCRSCRIDYEIRSGIPILMDLSKLPDHLRRQIQYFEHEDETRGDWVLEPWQARYVRNFLDIGKPKPGGLIIDNATGSGYMTIELARRGYRVIATDLTFRELVKLKRVIDEQGLGGNVLLVCCDSQDLPFADGVADGLAATAILEHLPDEKRSIGEIYRVAKKGAAVMVAMPLAYYLLLPILWLPNWLHDRRIGHLRRYTRKRILDSFPGFGEIRTYYTGHMLKVFCLLLYVLTKNTRWNALGERLDERFQAMPYGASNVVSILKAVG